MQRFRWILAFLACVRVCAPSGLSAQFQMLETSDMRLVFTSPLQSYLVPQVVRSFENSLQFHRHLFGYTPAGSINVLMHDLWHYGNAGASPIPANHITIGIEPYAHDYESGPAPERMTSSLNHEMAHIVTVDKATGSDRFYRSIFFGKVTPNPEVPLSMLYGYLTTPRWYAPRWYLEGIAVYLETWMNGGLGRAIGPYDEMAFRTLVRDSARIFDFVGLESEGTTIDFQVGVNSYLYGTRFVSYLGLRYGNDSLIAWYNRTEGSRRYFSTQFRHIYGRSLEDEWSRWIAWEHAWQDTNLAAIRRHPVTAFRPLTDHALGSVSRGYYDSTSRAIYLGVRYPGQVAHLASIDVASGKITNLAEILGAAGFSVTALAYDPASRTLFYTTDNANWRNLCAFDLATGRSRVLLRSSRIADLAFDPADRSLWGVRHDNGFSTLVRLPPPYHEWNQIETLPYGRDLFDLDISPDGSTLIGSMSEISGSQKLVRMDIAALRAKEATPEVLSDFGDWPPSNFVFSPDGKYLFGSSYYSGVSNIYRYDLARQAMEPLSNTETGFFKPVPLPGDSVVVFRYSARGFVPSMIPNQVPDSVSAIRFLGNEIAANRPDVQAWIPKQDSSLNLDSLMTTVRAYRPLAHLALNSAYPVLEGYQDAAGTNAVAIGGRANFSDQVGATALNLTASYSPRWGPVDRRAPPPARGLPVLELARHRGPESRGLLRPVRAHQGEPAGLFVGGAVQGESLYRRAANPDLHAAPGGVWPSCHAAPVPERGRAGGPAGGVLRRPHLWLPPALPRRRRGRAGNHRQRVPVRQLCRRGALPSPQRGPRPRLSPAPQPLVAVASGLGRVGACTGTGAIPSPSSSSEGSGTTGWTIGPAGSSGRPRAFLASGSTTSAARITAKHKSSGSCRPSGSGESGSPASISSGPTCRSSPPGS